MISTVCSKMGYNSCLCCGRVCLYVVACHIHISQIGGPLSPMHVYMPLAYRHAVLVVDMHVHVQRVIPPHTAPPLALPYKLPLFPTQQIPILLQEPRPCLPAADIPRRTRRAESTLSIPAPDACASPAHQTGQHIITKAVLIDLLLMDDKILP